MFSRAIAAALIGITVSGCATVPPSPPEAPASLRPDDRFLSDFDSFITGAMAQFPKVPALSVAVVRSDGPIFARAYGMADRENGIPATAETPFYIASATKTFVALALARLAARGEISLDWTLADLAPDVRFAPGIPPSQITLRHLLSHTHGLSGGGIEFRLAYSGEHDPDTLLGLLPRLSPNEKKPLGTFAYSNLGYNVAILLIERKLGRRWQDVVEQEVLRPVDLDDTLVQRLAEARIRPAAPYASLAVGGPARLPLEKTDATLQSAGGMYSSASDMAQWLALQLAAAAGRDGLPIASAVVRQTHVPVAEMDQSFGPFSRKAYGLGWYSGPDGGETLFHAFGGVVGSRAHTSFMPSRDLGVAISTNDEDIGFELVDVLATYAYDWFLVGPPAARENASRRLAELQLQADKQRQSRLESRSARAARPWRLTLPIASYTGRYCSDEMGTLTVGGSETVKVRIGQLSALAEPFTQPDSMRVELVPNSGQVLQFAVDDGKVSAVKAIGSTFRRCD